MRQRRRSRQRAARSKSSAHSLAALAASLAEKVGPHLLPRHRLHLHSYPPPLSLVTTALAAPTRRTRSMRQTVTSATPRGAATAPKGPGGFTFLLSPTGSPALQQQPQRAASLLRWKAALWPIVLSNAPLTPTLRSLVRTLLSSPSPAPSAASSSPPPSPQLSSSFAAGGAGEATRRRQPTPTRLLLLSSPMCSHQRCCGRMRRPPCPPPSTLTTPSSARLFRATTATR